MSLVTFKGNIRFIDNSHSENSIIGHTFTLRRGTVIEIPPQDKAVFVWQAAPANSPSSEFSDVENSPRIITTLNGRLVFSHIIREDAKRYRPVIRVRTYNGTHDIFGSPITLTVTDSSSKLNIKESFKNI